MSTRARWLRLAWRTLLSGRRPDDFTQEIAAHLDHEAAQLIAEGVAADEARLIARRRFGSVAAAEERFYESRRWMWLDRTRQDLRDAVRSLRRYPLAAAVGILSVAAGIGVASTTLTVRNVLFHNPPPTYGEPAQLSEVRVARGTQPLLPIGSRAPGGLVADWIAALGPAAIAAAQPPLGVRDVRSGDRLESVAVRAVTAETFDVLGVRPAAGRTFAAVSPAAAAAMLSYRLWQQWFDGRADVIGRTIWIENAPHEIVGVLPARFWLSYMERATVWTVLDPHALAAEDALDVYVRRPRGQSHEALRQTLEPLLARYAARQPADQRQLRMAVGPVEGTQMGKQMPLVLPWVFGVAALLTLIVACANVAILMIAQWTAREHEISIRASIGASRGRLVRALLTESIVIAACGGTIGLGVTLALRSLLIWRAGAGGGLFDLSVHPAMFLQVAAITAAAGIATGLAPALFETRRLYGNPVRVTAAAEPVRQRWRHMLVVLEIGITVALLVLTATFVNSIRRALDADLGFATRPLLSAEARNPKGVPLDVLLAAVQKLPGVAVAAVSTTVPYTASGPRASVAAGAAGAASVMSERGDITPAFFSVLGVPLVAGRTFTAAEGQPGARVAIVNEALARRLFGAPDGAGRTVWIDGSPHDVVGVVANFSNQQFFRDFEPRIFVPLTAPAPPRAVVAIRASDDPLPLVEAVRRAIRDAVAGTIVTRAYTFDTIRTIGSQEAMVGTAPLVPLITIGLLLTMTGIYGVLAFSIARRSRELAVRMAIGATGRDVVRLVAGNTARMVAIGAALGLGATFVMSRIVRASGGAGSFLDPEWPAFAVTIVIISAVAAAAAWGPSRRAHRIDPAVLLREI